MKAHALALVTTLGTVIASGILHAQTTKWPLKPVRLVIPFAPGGGIDALGRLLAMRMSEEYGQQFIPDNRGGAGGTIGTELVVRAAGDGYTLAMASASYSANAALLKLPYDPVKDIAPISSVVQSPRVLVIHPSVKATTVSELVALARAKPGSLNFGSSGTGSIAHLTTELFQQLTQVQMVHVAYKGDGPALVDLLGGQIQVFFGGTLPTLPHVRNGRLRGLGVTTEKRISGAPDLPALGETVPGYSASSWIGMFAPAATPRDVVVRLNESIGRMLAQSAIQERLRAEGAEPTHLSPEAFSAFIARDIAMWSKVVKTGNIRAQ